MAGGAATAVGASTAMTVSRRLATPLQPQDLQMAFGRIADIHDVYIPRDKQGIRWEEDDYGGGFWAWDNCALSACATSLGCLTGLL